MCLPRDGRVCGWKWGVESTVKGDGGVFLAGMKKYVPKLIVVTLGNYVNILKPLNYLLERVSYMEFELYLNKAI